MGSVGRREKKRKKEDVLNVRTKSGVCAHQLLDFNDVNVITISCEGGEECLHYKTQH